MPNLTTSFSLPYPAPSDQPCDFAEQWCDFTAALEAVFTRFQATVDRTVPVIPIALLTLSEPATVLGGIPFDTVVVDTAGWVDPDVDMTMISPDVAGVLTVTTNLVQTAATLNDTIILTMTSVGPVVTATNMFNDNDELDRATEFVGIYTEQEVFFAPGSYVPGVSGIRPVHDETNTSQVTMNYAQFCVYWHSDGGTV